MESNMHEINFNLVLHGSLYPLHNGHANLFMAAKHYISQLSWSDNLRISFGSFYLSPTSHSSLSRKHGGRYIDQELRKSQLNSKVRELNEELGSTVFVVLPHYDAHGSPAWKLMEDVRQEVEGEIDTAEGCRVFKKLVQIAGVDSRLQAIVNSVTRKNRATVNYPEWVPGMVHDLKLVLVEGGGRLTPSENESTVRAFQFVADVNNCTELIHSKTALLPKSSTMIRYIESHTFYPDERFRELTTRFNFKWLIDTGVTLGYGKGGVVRLMLIGGHTYVAVKVIRLAKKQRYEEEARIWRHLAQHASDTIPRLFATQCGKTYGVIVTEVGVPMTRLFPGLNSSDGSGKDGIVQSYNEFFQQFPSVCDFTGSEELPLPHPITTWLSSLTKEELTNIKLNIFKSLKETVLPGLHNSAVFHRDLKHENMLFLPRTNSLVLCDFGVSVLASDKSMKWGPRGALRYYPIKAIDNNNFYESWCDEYFASLSLLEILVETKLFSGLQSREVIEKRRNNIFPEIPGLVREHFSEPVLWIENMLKNEESQR